MVAADCVVAADASAATACSADGFHTTPQEEGSQDGVRKRLENEHGCSPVFIDRDMMDLYECFCAEVLWPILHW